MYEAFTLIVSIFSFGVAVAALAIADRNAGSAKNAATAAESQARAAKDQVELAARQISVSVASGLKISAAEARIEADAMARLRPIMWKLASEVGGLRIKRLRPDFQGGTITTEIDILDAESIQIEGRLGSVNGDLDEARQRLKHGIDMLLIALREADSPDPIHNLPLADQHFADRSELYRHYSEECMEVARQSHALRARLRGETIRLLAEARNREAIPNSA